MVRPVSALLVTLALAPIAARGQSTESFAAVSIKRNVSGVPYDRSADRPDGLAMVNERLRDAILFAYGLYDFQLTGAPEWVANERYDISARADRALSFDEKRERLRRVLADRFALRVHTDMRDQAIYALTRIDERARPGLTRRDCAVPGIGNLPCGGGIASADGGIMRLAGVPIVRLATFVGGVLGRVVNDETGLSGVYDIDWRWRPDIGMSPDLSDRAKADIEARPSLPVALREQLGLELQSRRGPVTVVVVDSVSRPTPD